MSAFTVELSRMEALTPAELYDVLKLRVDVFVVEQNCPYPELDGKDSEALHLRLLDGDNLIAYARLFAPKKGDSAARIGRVIVAPSRRGERLGPVLMDEAIAACERLYGDIAIEISAQSHLQRFYGRAGFITTSEEYLEDGIPHVEMLRSPAGSIAS